MRKLLILFFALAFLGCSNNDDLPCFKCDDGGSGSYGYCLLYNSHCSYMSVSDCNRNSGMPFGSSYECESYSSVFRSSSSSSVTYSSSAFISSSSSSITYTLACASVPTTGIAGMAITAPVVTCNGTTVSSDDLYWTGAPNWNNPDTGTYSGISVQAGYGNCSGKSAICGGTLAIQTVINYGTPVTYQGETYKTVVIGGQTWFQRNLNYAVAGSKCGNGSSLSDANTTTCDTYGRLYDWETAMKLPGCNSTFCSSQIDAKHHQGICPDGWHIPSNADWDKLMRYVDGTSGTESPYHSPTAGRYLKATSGWNNGGNGVDTYGFSALPGGYGYSGGYFDDAGNGGDWWSASEYHSIYAYSRDMTYGNENAYDNYYGKSALFSVRCLQD